MTKTKNNNRSLLKELSRIFYSPSINIDTASIEKLFIHKIFKMLLKKNLIGQRTIDLILSWAHTGFGSIAERGSARVIKDQQRTWQDIS